MASNQSAEISRLRNILVPLLNKQLQHICSVNGLRTGGNKADLQKRIIDALQTNVNSDPQTYNHLRNTIEQMAPGRGSGPNHHSQSNGSPATRLARPSPYSGSHNPAVNTHMSQNLYGNGYNYGSSQGRSGHQSGASYYPHKKVLNFKTSPFYTIDSLIGEVNTCEADDQGAQDISFPHQAELKVNGDDLKANLRGLKGKSGSTRPVDITQSLRLDKYSYVNNLEFTYALTSKKFYLAIYLCKTVPVEELVTRIQGKKIAKTTVVGELTKAAHDPDVVATSQVLSLKCPLTYMRLTTPCRSISCAHIQCFDANSYLQLQEQGPQWICPICNKPAAFDNLAVDEYVKDILDNTSESTDQVTIEPDGRWKTQGQSEPEAKKKPRYSNASHGVIDDDDVVTLDDFGVMSGRNTQTPNMSLLNTPLSSAKASGSPSGSKKRPAEVIDLTLDDSDDEPIARPPKRQNHGPTPTPTLPYYQSSSQYLT